MKKMTFNGVASSLSEKEMENVMAGSGLSGRSCMLMGATVAGFALTGIFFKPMFVAAGAAWSMSVNGGCFD
jgi:hypothetical protein